ncbi:MAG: hypothetical protein NVSMB62_29570 [Acidobacteriaceae bacterium]
MQEVTGPDVVGMVAEEGCPGLPMWSWSAHLSQVALNRPLGDLDPQLEQLALNTLDTRVPSGRIPLANPK